MSEEMKIAIVGAVIAGVFGIVAAIIGKARKKQNAVVNQDAPPPEKQAKWLTPYPDEFPPSYFVDPADKTVDTNNFAGPAKTIFEIMEYLENQTPNRVGITGVPGIGKKFYCGILAKHIERYKIYDNIAFVDCIDGRSPSGSFPARASSRSPWPCRARASGPRRAAMYGPIPVSAPSCARRNTRATPCSRRPILRTASASACARTTASCPNII